MIDMELMIHVSAPTTRIDDEKYKAEALAYEDFSPARTFKIFPEQSDSYLDRNVTVPDDVDEFMHQQAQSENPELSSATGLDHSLLLTSTQWATTVLQSQIYPDDDVNLGLRSSSASLRHILSRPAFTHGATVLPDGQQTRPSLLAGQDTVLPRLQGPTTVTAQTSDSLDSRLPSDYGLSCSNERSQAHYGSEEPGFDKENRVSMEVERGNVVDVVQVPRTVQKSTQSIRNFGPHTSAHSRHHREEDSEDSIIISSPSVAITRSTVHDKEKLKGTTSSEQQSHPGSAKIFDFKALPLEYRAPQPKKVLVQHVSRPSQITDCLRALKEKKEVRGKFQPVYQTREIEPEERGSWCIETSSWPPHLQYNFWISIGKFISSGKAGFCVRCTRNPPQNESSGLGIVKVWCWGELVEHTYLVIYVMSEDKVRKIGVQWRDGEDQVVIQM